MVSGCEEGRRCWFVCVNFTGIYRKDRELRRGRGGWIIRISSERRKDNDVRWRGAGDGKGDESNRGERQNVVVVYYYDNNSVAKITGGLPAG